MFDKGQGYYGWNKSRKKIFPTFYYDTYIEEILPKITYSYSLATKIFFNSLHQLDKSQAVNKLEALLGKLRKIKNVPQSFNILITLKRQKNKFKAKVMDRKVSKIDLLLFHDFFFALGTRYR